MAQEEDKDYDSVMEEINRRREERRKQQEEEEKREEEERKKREDERNQRKLEREKKAKEREESLAKEQEEKQKQQQKEEERKRKKEEREKAREEEQRKEKEEEEKRLKERAERHKVIEEADAEQRAVKREETQKRMSEEWTPPAVIQGITNREEPVVYSGRKKMIDKIMDIVKEAPTAGHKDTVDKLIKEEDMRDEVQRYLNEEHAELTEYFSNPEVIIVAINCLSVIPANPQSMRSAQVDGIVARMEFARDLMSGTIPHLWKKLLQVENYHVLDALFTLLRSDVPVLPTLHVNCFWKSLEFLIYRRGFDVSQYLLSRKTDVVASFFKHLKDSNVMDILIKLVDNEASTPAYKEYNPRDEAIPSWCDDLAASIITVIKKEDTETSDEEIDGLSNFVSQVFEKHPSCKLAYQLREYSFASIFVQHIFSGAIVWEPTLLSLINFLNILLKPSVNTSSYATDLLPPVVSSIVASLPSGTTPIDMLTDSLRNGSALQKPEKPNPKRNFLTKGSSFDLFKMKCLLCVQILTSLNFKCVDEALQASGTFGVCVDIFFSNQDNNIIHCCIEEMLKNLLLRELDNPEDGGKLTEHVLSTCNLVERIIEGLSTKKAIGSMKGKFDTRIESPPFVGHVLNICKLISHVADKSFATRSLIAECSGYRWGQVVLFKIGMRASSDNEWKAPMRKVNTTEVVASASGPVID